ncbi:MAG: hypothetical protein JNL60_10950 [Bacteroidia bacterium]|nr:hypothetical protein [Bacteroidia bacterium]
MMKKENLQNSMEDLDYLAEQGFGKVQVSASDLQKIRKKVRKITGKNNLLTGVLLFASGLLIGTALLYFLSPEKRHEVPISQNDISKMESLETHEAETTMLDTIEIRPENFIKPTAPVKKEKLKVPETEVLTESKDPVILEPQELSSIPQEKLEQKLKFISNAQVFYLHDMKITNYTTLYFRKNEFMGLRGHPADQGAADNTRPAGSSLKESPTIYLHEEIANAMLQFKKAKYDEAFQTLKLVSTYNDHDLNCDFYQAMCLYYKKNYGKAIVLFDACIDDANNTFYQEALFYKALSLQEKGDKEEVIKLLERIVNEKGFYAEKARNLLH